MDKQQHIEEMEKVIPEKIKDPLDNSRYIIFGKSLRREIARIYYNAGYRKLPVGAVVLLIGENNQALDEKTIEYFVKHNEQIRKEAVKEFAEKLWNTIKDKGIDYKIGLRALAEEIDELLKEYVKWKIKKSRLKKWER